MTVKLLTEHYLEFLSVKGGITPHCWKSHVTAQLSGRDEAQNKMLALKERSDKDMAQQEIEMKELQRIIQHDNKLKEFMGIKIHDRADLKEEEQAKKLKGKGSY